ncbi:MAG: phosphoglycerate kinase, partial [Bradymonadaceae bacterium]
MRRLREADVDGRRVLVREDFNVPLQNGGVADDFRIRAGLPTLEELMERGARTAVCSHLGRPGGQRDESASLAPVAERLGQLLGREVPLADDCVGPAAEDAVGSLGDGEIVLLENTRFHPGEKENAPGFAEQLAALADVYVNDAFATAHRVHASTEGVAHRLMGYAGQLMEREIDTLGRVRDNPSEPYVAALGGAKIADKIEVIDRLATQVETLLIGG